MISISKGYVTQCPHFSRCMLLFESWCTIFNSLTITTAVKIPYKWVVHVAACTTAMNRNRMWLREREANQTIYAVICHLTSNSSTKYLMHVWHDNQSYCIRLLVQHERERETQKKCCRQEVDKSNINIGNLLPRICILNGMFQSKIQPKTTFHDTNRPEMH